MNDHIIFISEADIISNYGTCAAIQSGYYFPDDNNIPRGPYPTRTAAITAFWNYETSQASKRQAAAGCADW